MASHIPSKISTVMTLEKFLELWIKGKWDWLPKFRDDEDFCKYKESLEQKCRENGCERVLDDTFKTNLITAGSDDDILWNEQRAAIDDAIEKTVSNDTTKTFIESDKSRPDLYWPKIMDWFEKAAVAIFQA